MRIHNLLIRISVDNDPRAKLAFSRGILWGYPDLVEKLFEEVRPVMVEAREKRREREEAEQQETTADSGSLRPVPEAVGQAIDDTASVPPQSSQPVSLGDGVDYVSTTQTGIHPDSLTQADEHPHTHERALLTESGSAEAMQPTSADPNSQPLVPGVADRPDEIDEIPSGVMREVDDPPPFGMERIVDPDARSALELTARSDAQRVSQMQAIDLPSLSNGH